MEWCIGIWILFDVKEDAVKLVVNIWIVLLLAEIQTWDVHRCNKNEQISCDISISSIRPVYYAHQKLHLFDQ